MQIAKKEVCFWEDADILSNIEELCKGHSYPPRITLRVTSGDYVREGLFLPVSFTGINGLFDSVNNNFQLELTMPQTECKTNMQS